MYGGTKTEMERLIADANEYAAANGMAADLTIDSFSDIVTAIDLIQQKQNIAGTTAREASTTIAGSLMTIKAAWDNLVTGFADPNADIGELTKNVITSAGVAASNIVPAVMQAVRGISEAFSVVLPQALAAVPGLIKDIGIPMLKVGAEFVASIGQGIFNALPELLSVITELAGQLGDSIDGAIPSLIERGLIGLTQFSETIRSGAGQLVSAGLNLILQLAQGIAAALPTIIAYAPTIISNFAGVINDNAPKLISTGLQIIIALGKGLIQAIPTLIANIPQILAAIWDAFMAFNWLALGGQITSAIANGAKSFAESIPNVLRNAGKSAWNAFKNINWSSAGRMAISFIGRAISALVNLPGVALRKAASLGMKAFTGIAWGTVGSNIIQGIVRGIAAGAGALFNSLRNLAKSALDTAKRALGINSPSKVFRDEVGVSIPEGMAKGVNKAEKSVNAAIDTLSAGLHVPEIIPQIGNVDAPTATVGAMGTNGGSGTNNGMSVVINLNYNAPEDANDMLRDIARGLNRYKLAGAI